MTPPHTQHCRVGPPMPGYVAVYGPPDADGAEPVVALVPVTNPRAAADAALFAEAWRLRAACREMISVLATMPSDLTSEQRNETEDPAFDRMCAALDAADGIESTPAPAG